jgi:type II secretory pathway component GspD/PulD (secretin)
MRYIGFIFIIIFLNSCAITATKEKIHKPALEPSEYDIVKTKPKRAIEYVPVRADSLRVETTNLNHYPHIEKIKVYGADFYDVLTLMMEATGESIIIEQQNENIEKNLKLKSSYPVYISAENIGFGPLLQQLAGNRLSVKQENGIYFINSVQKANIKVPPIPALAKTIQTALGSFGATNVVYDNITSSISFTARQKDYESIMKYINTLKKNLYVIEYDIAIYSVSLNDDFGMGIDWSSLKKNGNIEYTANSKNTLGASLDSASPLTFGVVRNTALFNITGLIKVLERYGKVESVQRPTLLGLAGTPVKLKDGLEETYIKEIKSKATNTSAGTTNETETETEKILSGIDITLTSNLLDETVITDIKLKINDIVGYNEFKTSDVTYKHPKIMTKDIANTLRVKAGEPILISGLFKSNDNKNYRGIPGTSDIPALSVLGGAQSREGTKSEMVIIVTPRVIKYIME